MSLANPIWLIALFLLPLIVVAAILATRARTRQWSSLVAERLRGALIRRTSSLPRWLSLGLLMAAAALLIGGLARPQGEAGTRTEKSVGRNLLLALDLSRSMRVQDVRPDRLSNAKLVIFELIEALPNERIGLVGFAGSSYLYAPLTVDHAAVRETVEQMDEGWPTVGGSDLGGAVRLSIDTLRETGQKNNVLVILSDGEKHSGELDQMISEARAAGVYILTIGIGTEDGDYAPPGLSRQPHAQAGRHPGDQPSAGGRPARARRRDRRRLREGRQRGRHPGHGGERHPGHGRLRNGGP